MGEGRPTPNTSKQVGADGELAARHFLERKGCSTIAANVRFGRALGLVGELDLIVRDGATVAFVEVKARRGFAGHSAPGEAVTPAKQRQIVRLALAWLARDSAAAGIDDDTALRFDVVTVVLDPSTNAISAIEHMPGAFTVPDGMDY